MANNLQIITQRTAISWLIQLILVAIAAATVWVYMARDHSLSNERRYYALSGALSQVGVAYWEKDIQTGEFRFGENFSSFLGIGQHDALNLPASNWIEAILEYFRQWHPQPLTVDNWIESVHPEDRNALSDLLDIDDGSFSGSFRIQDNTGGGWRQVLASGVVHGELMVGVVAAFPDHSQRIQRIKNK